MKTIIAFSLMLFAAAAHGQLLKCVGKDGRVEYANLCPSGTRQETTGIRNAPPPAPGGGSEPKSYVEKESDFRKRLADKEEAEAQAAKKAAEAKQRQQACNDARAYMKNLQARNRILRTDPVTGEQRFLDEAGYAPEIARAQASIDANCK